MRTSIKLCWQLKMNLKKNIYLYANSTTQRCPKENKEIFLIEDFFHLPLVSTTLVVHLELRISPQIFEKIWNGRNGVIVASGKMIHLENLKPKISWHCPLNMMASCTSLYAREERRVTFTSLPLNYRDIWFLWKFKSFNKLMQIWHRIHQGHVHVHEMSFYWKFC